MRNVNEFWAIDFDRCLGNVDSIYPLFERLMRETIGTIDIAALEITRFELESAGGSFDMLAYIQQHSTDDEAYQTLIRAFSAEAAKVRDSLLMPGAHELLDYLECRSLPYGIVSYGHEAWQMLKIQATGLGDTPRLIVDQSHKGEVITSWWGNGGFAIPATLAGDETIVSKGVVLVDDKAISFTGLPEGARGYWVRPAELLRSQEGTIPAAVQSVARLDEIISIEEGRQH